jgi:membrane associated rhomboid family serine protease
VSDRNRLFYAVWATAAFLFLIWSVHIADLLGQWDLRSYGNRPREMWGLIGILSFPFLHSGWEHLWNNTASFFTLNMLLFYFYRSIALRVWLRMYVWSGALLWIIGGTGNHIGASGMVYALAAFLFASGILRKHHLLMRVSLVVVFLYGGMVWWMLPIEEHISWEGHLAGAFCGAVLAFFYRPDGPPDARDELPEEDPNESLPEWWLAAHPEEREKIEQQNGPE